MIYDVFADFNAGDIRYDKDSTDPRVPVDSLSQFYNNKIKIETTKIKDIEKALSEYTTLTDEVLGIDVHNEDQYKRLKDARMKMGISEDIYPTDLKDLSNTAKLTQFNAKVKRYMNSPEVKMILDEQKKGNDYRQKANEIMSMNEPLGILAMKDYLEKYGNKSDKSYNGFELNINDYIPMDVDAEIAKLAQTIEIEYRLEKDPNSPTDDGYLFINKISGFTENGKAVLDRKVNALKSNKRFDNNMKSYIAMNSDETDYNDPKAYNNFLSEMIDTHLGDKIVSTDVKKIDTKVVLGEGGNSSGSSTPIKDSRTTESERLAYLTRDILERNPNYKDYDFEGLEIAVMGMPKGYFKAKDEIVDEKVNGQPTGNKILQVTFSNGKAGEEVKITVPKIGEGGKRTTLAEMEQAQAPTVAPSSNTGQSASKEDVTINNPERAKVVMDLNLQPGKGDYTAGGQWVYRGDSGKVVVITDPVPLAQDGFSLKDNKPETDYHLSRSTANKAKPFVDSIGDYEITEAGTDTVRGGHSSQKHYNGTTFDIALRGDDANDHSRIFDTIIKASNSGLAAQFESNDKALVDKVNSKIKAYNARNGNNPIEFQAIYNKKWKSHLSIYDNEPIDVVKPGQIAALDIASDDRNESYNDFVKKNNLKNRTSQEVLEFNANYLETNYPEVYKEVNKQEYNPEQNDINWSNQNFVNKNVQIAMSLIAQSKPDDGLSKYLKSNPTGINDIIKFVKSPEIQEMYMDQVIMDEYNPIISNTPSSKFSNDEKLILLHVEGKTDGQKVIKGEIPAMTGYEMLEKYGFIVDDEYIPNKKRENEIIEKLEKQNSSGISQGVVSLFKLALKKANGEIPYKNNPKDVIAAIETNNANGEYGKLNARTTAIGKYQFMWNFHKEKIKELLKNYQPTQEETQQMNVSLPEEMKGDSISNKDIFK